jgi:hypothetical protein
MQKCTHSKAFTRKDGIKDTISMLTEKFSAGSVGSLVGGLTGGASGGATAGSTNPAVVGGLAGARSNNPAVAGGLENGINKE